MGAPVCCNGKGDALLAGKGEEDGGNGVERAAVWGGCGRKRLMWVWSAKGEGELWFPYQGKGGGFKKMRDREGAAPGLVLKERELSLVPGCRGEEKNQRGGAASLCKQGKGGLRPPLLPLVFFSMGMGGAAPCKKTGLGLGFFFCIFLMFPKLTPPLKIQYSMVFIGRVLLGFQISPSTFLFLLFSSFFVNFDFSYFFVF